MTNCGSVNYSMSHEQSIAAWPTNICLPNNLFFSLIGDSELLVTVYLLQPLKSIFNVKQHSNLRQ